MKSYVCMFELTVFMTIILLHSEFQTLSLLLFCPISSGLHPYTAAVVTQFTAVALNLLSWA